MLISQYLPLENIRWFWYNYTHIMASKLPTVAIVGHANAGKSSLFNRLVRSKQAIVAAEAGTTRDNVSATVDLGDRQFRVVDTAGLKPAEDELKPRSKTKSPMLSN